MLATIQSALCTVGSRRGGKMEQGMCLVPREWGGQRASLPCHLEPCQSPTERQVHATPCSDRSSGEAANVVTWRWLHVPHVTSAQHSDRDTGKAPPAPGHTLSLCDTELLSSNPSTKIKQRSVNQSPAVTPVSVRQLCLCCHHSPNPPSLSILLQPEAGWREDMI